MEDIRCAVMTGSHNASQLGGNALGDLVSKGLTMTRVLRPFARHCIRLAGKLQSVPKRQELRPA